MSIARALVAALTVLFIAAQPVANAATPSSGTLSKKSKSVKWNGTFTLSEPDSVGGCVGGSTDPICDHYLLKVNLPDGARIRIDLPAPDGVSDLDLYVYSPTGAEVGSSANFLATNEFVEFRHSGRFRNKPYEVRITPWLVVPGTTYTATAKVR
jgi:hypothetical protein